MSRPSSVIVAVCAIVAHATAFAGGPAPDAPFHCYLTWEDDPTTTITVNFHTRNPHTLPEVRFDSQPHSGNAAAYPFRVTATTHVIPGLNDFVGASRQIHVAQLDGLTAGGTYYFVAGSPDGGYTAERQVQLPSANPVGMRFVVGGDVATGSAVPGLLQAAAAQSPVFAIIGGDAAYDDGELSNWPLWEAWLQNWETYMVTPEGATIPIVMAIGNHEVAGGFNAVADPLASAPFYFGYFAQSGRGFSEPRSAVFRRDFGPELMVLILDSGHVTAVGGEQADWIADQLASARAVDLRLAAYHVAMYPSHRPFDGLESARLRDAWLPLFDAWELDLAFEHHDHMLKRTLPLRANRPEFGGTVYIGDGCFGQEPRTGEQAMALDDPAELAALGLEADYLDHWASARHFWLVEVEQDTRSGRPQIALAALNASAVVLDDTVIIVDDDDDHDHDSSGFVCFVSLVLGANSGANAYAVAELRSFRDARLMQSRVGTVAVSAYYRLSPALCDWFSARPQALDWIRRLSSRILEIPASRVFTDLRT